MDPFPRTLKLGSRGPDVEAAKRAVYRLLGTGELTKLARKRPADRRVFGPFFRTHVKTAQRKLGIPQTGTIGPLTAKALAPHLDAYARSLLVPEKPKRVEPYQGWGSLDPDLWDAFSVCRNLGLVDGPGTASGTYNPASRLPGGGLSDHARRPALAFDLDTDPDGPAGWDSPRAQRAFREMMGRPDVEYVILGDKIWSRRGGLRAYTSGGHLNHIHVSGRR